MAWAAITADELGTRREAVISLMGPMRERGIKKRTGARCIFAAFTVCMTFSLQVSATDYYVDASGGSDSNLGTSTAAAWRTLTKVNGTALQAGDRVRFKRGESWRGRLAILRQGTAANPIVLEPYGTGAAPILNSSTVVSAWSDAGTNLLQANVASRVEQLFLDGVRGQQQSSTAELSGAGDWHWASGKLTIYASSVPGLVEASVDMFALWFVGAAHVHADGFNVIRSLHPVWLLNTNNITLENLNVIDGSGYAGIVITAELANRGRQNVVRNCEVLGTIGNSASMSFASNGSGIYVIGNAHCGENLIENNRVHDNGHEGIQLASTDNNVVRGNEVYNHAQSGIRVGLPDSHGNLIEHNTVYGNANAVDDRYGIDLIYVGNDNVVRYNTTFGQLSIPGGSYKSGGIRFDGNDGAGNVLTESTGNTAYYNLVYDEFTGINVFSFSNVSIYNNTVVASKDFGIAANSPAGIIPTNTTIMNNLVAPASGTVFAHVNLSNSTVDHNHYFVPSGSFFGWNTFLLSFSTYKALSHLDGASLTGDPKFVDAAALDFSLQEISPARERGVDVGLSRDFAGTSLPQGDAPDIGAFEYVVEIVIEAENEGSAEGAAEGAVEGFAEGSMEGTLEGGSEGAIEGAGEGTAEGNLEGTMEGGTEGSIEGMLEGEAEGDGATEGLQEGLGEGVVEGAIDGELEGSPEGGNEGFVEGSPEGAIEGDPEGVSEGTVEGTVEGAVEGLEEGHSEGMNDGEVEGEPEGGITPEGEGEEAPLIADFEANTLSGAAPLAVSFVGILDDLAKSEEALWTWDFGDGSFGDGSQESHVYQDPGSYTVTLIVTHGEDAVSVVKPDLIAVDAPLPVIKDWRWAMAWFILTLLAGRKLSRPQRAPSA